MGVYKGAKTGTWFVKTYYTDYTDTKRQHKKRGFQLQRDAKEWERDFLLKQTAIPGYMQNLVMELSSVLNFAVRFYGLSVNPCRIAGNTVGQKQKSLNFWTKAEFDRFIATFDRSDPYYITFLILYYTGMRIGELEALTVADVDLTGCTITINKTYHLINGEGVIITQKADAGTT